MLTFSYSVQRRPGNIHIRLECMGVMSCVGSYDISVMAESGIEPSRSIINVAITRMIDSSVD